MRTRFLAAVGLTVMALRCSAGNGGNNIGSLQNTGGASGSNAGSSGTGGKGGTGGSIIGTGGSLSIGGSSGSSGSGGTLNPDAACTGVQTAGERIPGNLLFVVDKSGSMNCNSPPVQTTAECEPPPEGSCTTACLKPKDATQPTKWQIVQTAIESVLTTLPITSSAGIVFFPNDNLCGVSSTLDVPIAHLDATQIAAFTTSLNGVTPVGDTPIVGGVTLGYAALQQASLVGNRFLVLITDGSETCATGQIMTFGTQTVPTALAAGMPTFVIGAPGSEQARAFLSAIAWNGGTASSPTCDHSGTYPDQGDCHFDMTTSGSSFATQLNQALDFISSSTVSCEIPLPPPPDGGVLDPNLVNVTLYPGGSQPPQELDKTPPGPCVGGVTGWQYSADGTKVELCGNACNAYKASRDASVTIELGCKTREGPPR